MKKTNEELRSEGRSIAEKLGNGVRYVAPWMDNGNFRFHLFNDDAVTDTSFSAKTLEEAKKKLTLNRKAFNASLPTFTF